jgi:hypothetical protein
LSSFKSKGFDSPAHLQEHLDDVEESEHASAQVHFDGDDDTHVREVAWLRKEVSDLRLQLETIYGGPEASKPVNVEAAQPWLKIAGTVAIAYVLARIARRPGLST